MFIHSGLSIKNQISNNDGEQTISPLGMAKYLDDKLKSANVRHCETCQCATRDLRVLADIDQTYSIGTQTILQGDILNSVLCLRCNDILNSPGSNHTPFNMFISCDSIVSDAKSSYSCGGSYEKLPIKRDELMVNPILSHTPISDRTIKKIIAPAPTPIQSIEGSSMSSGTQPKNPTIVDTKKLRNSERSTAQQQKDRVLASSSSSLSNRSSVNVDGPKLFENFNRNLIKSIKVKTLCVPCTHSKIFILFVSFR